MGYYTYYTVEVVPHSQKAIDAILDVSDYSETIIDGGDSVKWYDHEDDMLIVSRKFPEHTFIVSGNGEDSGDIWKKWFRDGKMKTAKVELRIEEPPW